MISREVKMLIGCSKIIHTEERTQIEAENKKTLHNQISATLMTNSYDCV